MPLCNPTQDEKGRLDLRFREDVEQALGVAFDPARQVLPATTLNCGSESFDLKIILDVDCHRICSAEARLPLRTFFDWRSDRKVVRQRPDRDPSKRLGCRAHGRSP